MNNLFIRKGDSVIVLSGKDKGKKGKVLTTDSAKDRVYVEGINMVTQHRKPRKQGESGGIIKKEAPLNSSKVMRVCPKCGKPTRIAHKLLEDGSKTRLCKKCGDAH